MSRDPYRDETSSLRAENERLRDELATRRATRSRPWLAIGTAAADVLAYVLVRPWLNGGTDAGFYGALAILVALALAALGFALGFPRTRTRSPSDRDRS
jgi:hypothetical protein